MVRRHQLINVRGLIHSLSRFLIQLNMGLLLRTVTLSRANGLPRSTAAGSSGRRPQADIRRDNEAWWTHRQFEGRRLGRQRPPRFPSSTRHVAVCHEREQNWRELAAEGSAVPG